MLDCGLNEGRFSRWIADTQRCNIVGFEPDPALFARLPDIRGLTAYPYAVASHSGWVRLYRGRAVCSSVFFREDGDSAYEEVRAVDLEAFADSRGWSRIDLLKMDVEGSEYDVLEGLSDSFLAARVGQLTVEFHDWIDSSTADRVDAIVERLKELDFFAIQYSWHTRGDYLFVNTRLNSLTWRNQIVLVLYKYLMGIRRILRRAIGRATRWGEPSHLSSTSTS